MKKLFLILLLSFLTISPAMATLSIRDLASQKIKDTPADLQITVDYDGRTDGQPVYLGMAVKSATTAESVWIIYKFTYDGSDQMLTRKSAYGIWDNRASLTYE